MDVEKGVREVLNSIMGIAIEAERAQRERLGRPLTEEEAQELAEMVARQARLALAMLKC